jgi:hypothetical protein
MRRHVCSAVMLALLGLAPEAAGQSRVLEDGTLVVSPMVVAAEMIVDEAKAKRKYSGKAIQLEGPLYDKLMTARGLDLTIMAQPPGYVGYRKFWCRSTDRSSADAAEAISKGQKVAIVGIYQPETRGDIPAEEIAALRWVERTDWQATLRLDSCLVLTGNPGAERKRRSVAAEAASRQDDKKQ